MSIAIHHTLLTYAVCPVAHMPQGKRTGRLVDSCSTSTKVVAGWRVKFLQAALQIASSDTEPQGRGASLADTHFSDDIILADRSNRVSD